MYFGTQTKNIQNVIIYILVEKSYFCKVGYVPWYTDEIFVSYYGPIQEMARASEKCWLNTSTTTC